MSGGEGWRFVPAPAAIKTRGNAIDDPTNFPPVEPSRVVGLGAICDFRVWPQRFEEAGDQSFSASECVTLEDGRRVTLHENRGFTIGWRSTAVVGPLRGQRETLEQMTRGVLNAVHPDDDECGEDHPWRWLADLARARGLHVTEQDLRGLPYEVVFTDRVRRWLAPG